MGAQQGLRLARWKYVWTSQAPTKIKCFVWLVAKRACLTQEALQRKGVQLVPRCFLCNETNETTTIFFYTVESQVNYVFSTALLGNCTAVPVTKSLVSALPSLLALAHYAFSEAQTPL
ncbi:hypothetical protein MTR67_033797 [Solanum verrucosum]|uniref:Reverse transcriptase zinc-binding domain-containing protein n=1 Tax=Solanum verrucosum TaxID=315347 RepID=A0AAF0ZIL8_SOLVR|nr:hypothetical protein MTR67_033797 [Solanum verrucosum]